MLDWLREHQAVLSVLIALSLLMFVITLIAVPWVVLRLPADYFSRPHTAHRMLQHRHPVLRICFIVLKNIAGVILVLAGLVLSIPAVPGQGILTLIAGLALLDFPGKRSLELRIVSFGPVRKALDWIRSRGNKPPLDIPETSNVTTGVKT
jgi:hypothetical protein